VASWASTVAAAHHPPLVTHSIEIRGEIEGNGSRVLARTWFLFVARLLRTIHQDEWTKSITARWVVSYVGMRTRVIGSS
jgi:hypothetical protein